MAKWQASKGDVSPRKNYIPEIGLWEVINSCNSCDLVSTKLHPTTGYCPECQTQTEQGELK